MKTFCTEQVCDTYKWLLHKGCDSTVGTLFTGIGSSTSIYFNSSDVIRVNTFAPSCQITINNSISAPIFTSSILGPGTSTFNSIAIDHCDSRFPCSLCSNTCNSLILRTSEYTSGLRDSTVVTSRRVLSTSNTLFASRNSVTQECLYNTYFGPFSVAQMSTSRRSSFMLDSNSPLSEYGVSVNGEISCSVDSATFFGTAAALSGSFGSSRCSLHTFTTGSTVCTGGAVNSLLNRYSTSLSPIVNSTLMNGGQNACTHINSTHLCVGNQFRFTYNSFSMNGFGDTFFDSSNFRFFATASNLSASTLTICSHGCICNFTDFGGPACSNINNTVAYNNFIIGPHYTSSTVYLSSGNNSYALCASTTIGARGDNSATFGGRACVIAGSNNSVVLTNSLVSILACCNSTNSFIRASGSTNSIKSNNTAALANNVDPPETAHGSTVLSTIANTTSSVLAMRHPTIVDIPTSSAGLPQGHLWRCTADSTLRIVL